MGQDLGRTHVLEETNPASNSNYGSYNDTYHIPSDIAKESLQFLSSI